MVKPFPFFYHLLHLCLIQLSILSTASGFTVDLIHRDSPISPLYNASETPSHRLKSVITLSHSRAAYLRKLVSESKQNIVAPVVSAQFEFLIELSIGTPPQPIYGIIDTGSDLSWTQCSPCVGCYEQDYPLFDPNKSSTYKPLLCSSNKCTALNGVKTSCDPGSQKCKYEATYGDGSYSIGEVADETFTFGDTVVPDLTFGCGQDDQGLFKSTDTGIIGLGLGKGSLLSQLNGPINGKFSYCFTNYDPNSNITGKISFGDDAVVSGPGVVSTPILKSPKFPDFYQLTLESIKLGSKTFPYRSTKSPNFSAGKGNIIIDSGTTLTYLPNQLVFDLETELRKAILGDPVDDPEGFFILCYRKGVELNGPAIAFEFDGGVLEVPQVNAFVETDLGLLCLGIVRDESDLPIFGNLLQVNFLVGYDVVANKLSFKPADCSKQ